MKKKFSKISSKTVAMGAIAVLVLAGLVGAMVARSRDYDATPNNTQTADQANDPDNGASPIDEVDAEDSKEAAADSAKSPTPAPASKPSTPVSKNTVTIEHVEQAGTAVTIGAYSDFPSAGTCTVTFKQGSSTVTKSVSSYVNAAKKNICDFPSDTRCVDTGGGTVACKDPFIKRSEFPAAGQWQATVSFSGGGQSGQSAAKTFTLN